MSEQKVKSGQVVSIEYTLRVDGKVIDSSVGGEPLEYLHGASNIIPGLEREIEGMAVGESKNVVVSPEDGYGEVNEEAFIEAPRSVFPPDIPLRPGVELQLTGSDGSPLYARIEGVEEDVVVLNLNHPLAGKELHFDITVVGLRDATAEELKHGHTHGGHAHH